MPSPHCFPPSSPLAATLCAGQNLARITGGEHLDGVLVRNMCVCLIDAHIRSNESGAIMWLQTTFPNKRRMLSVASRVFHWNHTFIQPVSCPWVFLSARRGNPLSPSPSPRLFTSSPSPSLATCFFSSSSSLSPSIT